MSKKGTVTAMKMQGTATVTVHRQVMHPVYKKRFRSSKKFLVDPAGHDIGVGDEVRIVECKPISKRKCFKIEEVLKRAPRLSEMSDGDAVEKAIHREKVRPVETKKPEEKAPEPAAEKTESTSPDAQ